jgi:hypothetical protein
MKEEVGGPLRHDEERGHGADERAALQATFNRWVLHAMISVGH